MVCKPDPNLSKSESDPVRSDSFGFHNENILDRIGLERLFHNWIGLDWMSTTKLEIKVNQLFTTKRKRQAVVFVLYLSLYYYLLLLLLLSICLQLANIQNS